MLLIETNLYVRFHAKILNRTEKLRFLSKIFTSIPYVVFNIQVNIFMNAVPFCTLGRLSEKSEISKLQSNLSQFF